MSRPRPAPLLRQRSGKPVAARALLQQGDAAAGEHRLSRALWLAQTLRQRIISGFYPPGARIRQADQRAEFGL